MLRTCTYVCMYVHFISCRCSLFYTTSIYKVHIIHVHVHVCVYMYIPLNHRYLTDVSMTKSCIRLNDSHFGRSLSRGRGRWSHCDTAPQVWSPRHTAVQHPPLHPLSHLRPTVWGIYSAMSSYPSHIHVHVPSSRLLIVLSFTPFLFLSLCSVVLNVRDFHIIVCTHIHVDTHIHLS